MLFLSVYACGGGGDSSSTKAPVTKNNTIEVNAVLPGLDLQGKGELSATITVDGDIASRKK